MSKKYEVVSSVAKGMPLNKPFLKAINTFLKERKGTLKLFEVQANYKIHKLDKDIDPSLLITSDEKFSKNIRLVYIDGLRAETGSAVSRLAGFCGLEETLITGGTQISLKSLPSYPNEQDIRVGRYVATTGALVYPKYFKSNHSFTARQAQHDHECGAIVLIKDDNGDSDFVHIKASKDGSFCFMNKRYHPSGKITLENNISMVLGDLHPVSVDPKALQTTLSLIKKLKIKDAYLNDADDFRNGLSHHLQGKNRTKARLALEGKLEQKTEQIINYNTIKSIQDAVTGNTFINKSNHDEHRDSALERADFIFDPYNAESMCIQFLLSLHGADAYQASLIAEDSLRKAIKEIVKNLNNHDYNSVIKVMLDKGLSKTRFLNRSTLKIVNGKLVISKHGDAGIGGSKGSTKSFAQLGIGGVYGHGHFEEWHKNVIRVATLSKLNMDYNEGQPTNWSHSVVLVYEDGIAQIVRIKNGKVLE